MTDGSSMENHYILYLKLDMEDKEVHLKPDMDMEVNLRLDMEVNLRLDMEVMQGHTMLVESEPQGAGKDTIFAELIEEAKRAASDGGTMSRFSLTVKLLQAKSYYRISNVAFNAILLILALQYPNSSIPKSYEEALSIIGRLGLGYDSIHVCPNNCVLFRKDYAKENNCPKCKASRWKDADGRRQIPEKVLRHFPLIPRLQRMFLSKEQSKEVQWHKLKRQDVENDLSHPADGDAWKDFDNIHKDFAADARNIRLGLATDGFNPYGNMSNSYSMWPVFVVPYNLPPWACMDQSNFMLALLIPGPSSPGKDFDVFMEPLMEELQELWKGVKSFLVVRATAARRSPPSSPRPGSQSRTASRSTASSRTRRPDRAQIGLDIAQPVAAPPHAAPPPSTPPRPPAFTASAFRTATVLHVAISPLEEDAREVRPPALSLRRPGAATPAGASSSKGSSKIGCLAGWGRPPEPPARAVLP
ncbi:hypothetical protein QYE76_069641 [Lolium multiflorum]|uniref:Transposase n=1 Tax=Lolium multiflorum TaxID=4521 RepID=A0AAD8SI54_LOLMU|nr:hypothetical protein QYE76_069641 [Lolium multiflorum]